MKKLVTYPIAVLLVVFLVAPIASARGGRGGGANGGGLGSTSSQYTGQGYWSDLGTANSSLGGQPNAMTQPTAPWLAHPQIPSRWRAWETSTPNWPVGGTAQDQPQPGGTVEMSAVNPAAGGTSSR